MTRDELKLYAAGISYKTSEINVREKYQINSKEIKEALVFFGSIEGVKGIVIISTCNRVEFYMVLQKDAQPFELLKQYYNRDLEKDITVDISKFYLYEGNYVTRHLFKVISGLDSMVLGEYQIQGQVKDAYSLACSEKTADKILHKLFHTAFRTGKAVRTRTRIGMGSLSISCTASKVIKERISRNDSVAIIGVNENTRIIAKSLYDANYKRLIFVNRTYIKAEEMAAKFQGEALNLKSLRKVLLNSKCIVSCTGAPGYIIDSETLNKIYAEKELPKLIIDLAMPRDVEINGLKHNIEIFDLDRLSRHIEKEQNEVILAIPEAERIIEDESRIFEVWNEAQSYNTLVFFDEKVEAIRLQILNEYRTQVPETEIGLLNKFSRTLIHRMKSTIAQAVKINLGENEIPKTG